MNVTELARKLKIPTSELLDALPQLGFDIGRRAIKVDDRVADRIIQQWPALKKRWEQFKTAEDMEEESIESEQGKKTVKIPPAITVREFAGLAGLNVSQVLGELMKNGIFVSMNERIDYDTAAIIGDDLNLEVVLAQEAGKAVSESEDKLKKVLAEQEQRRERPPVIVVMGHVDHGKTKLLDTIRKTNVAEKEVGGITQHIGAYQIEYNGRLITFIDTPGHEVFTAIRSRGAKVADIAILVVAADDGVKPQTIEAERIIEQAKLPFVVAINKIDKPEADIEKTKSDLSNQLKIIPEEWGGQIICVPISAKQGTNIDALLQAILLTAEMNKEKISANPNASAMGTVIESHIDKGEGPVATVLIQNGTLKSGDVICINNQPFGRVRVMKNEQGQDIKEARPSMPVKIVGLKTALNIGDIIEIAGKEQKLRLKKIKKAPTHFVSEIAESADEEIKKLNIIVRSDVSGSLEAIEEALEKIDSKEIRVKIVSKGLGNVTAGDVHHALASKALIISFNVAVPPAIEQLARDKEIEIKSHKVIYELIDYVKEKMEEMLGMETKQTELGRVKVLAIFRSESDSQVVGGKIEEGKINADSRIDVLRGEQKVVAGQLVQLQINRQDVKEAIHGQECGIKFMGKPVIEVGDVLRVYREEEVSKKL